MRGYAGDVLPKQAWAMLAADPRAMLIDVRTPAEWAYVGVPNLASLGREAAYIPWALFPSMQINPEFAAHVESVAEDRDAPLLFLCRSGARSRAAAVEMTMRAYTRCYNIATGFEGDPDSERHRGRVNGWKVEGLPWVQG